MDETKLHYIPNIVQTFTVTLKLHGNDEVKSLRMKYMRVRKWRLEASPLWVLVRLVLP